MLEALRTRDAEQRWEATGQGLPAPPQPLPPVVEPVLTAPAWRPSREPADRTELRSVPARVAVQEPELSQPYEPLVPVPEGDPEGVFDRDSITPIARTPNQLRRINEILPYYDYHGTTDPDDPCMYLCPRPDGAPCKQYDDPDLVPACPEDADDYVATLSTEPFSPRSMPPSCFAWAASNISYNPLYFEDVPLERYGHTYGDCVQPFVSLGKFSVQLIGLPYQMALDPPCKEVYPLGYYRPGEPAPKLFYQVPLNAKAAAIAAGVYTGIGVVLP